MRFPFLTIPIPVYTGATFSAKGVLSTGFPNAMRRLRTNSGFTLIELMITLVVAAVLLAWAVPSFQRFMDRTTLTSETNQWVGMINAARNEAITLGRRVTVCRTTDPLCSGTGTCACGGSATFQDGVLVFASDPGTAVPTQFNDGAGHRLLAAHESFSDKIVILANDAADGGGDGTLSFRADGTLEEANAGSPSARFVICPLREAGNSSTTFNTNAITGRYVEVNATGRPRVDELNAGDACTSTAADSL